MKRCLTLGLAVFMALVLPWSSQSNPETDKGGAEAVWSFQRKPEGLQGRQKMNHGRYDSRRPDETRLSDYLNETAEKGKMVCYFGWDIESSIFYIAVKIMFANIAGYRKISFDF